MELTFDSLKGVNFGFPLRPYLSSWVSFFKAIRTCRIDEGDQTGVKKRFLCRLHYG
jgi:hypothetical protein